MTPHVGMGMSALFLVVLAGLILGAHAHQDPCHRLHSCASDSSSYVCGDKGRCDQCPDNHLCLAAKPRPASSPTPAPAQAAPSPSVPTTPSAVTVCFTPDGNCTGRHCTSLGPRQANDTGASLFLHLGPDRESPP
jgi:hypothetical protein